MIFVFNYQKDLKINKGSLRALVQTVLDYLAISYEEVAIYLITQKKISKLHKQFFNDSSPTDCISFPIDDKYLGEVFVCPKTALEYSKKHNLDPLKEISLYVIHGLLHLIGYDDLTEKDRRVMRKKEKNCMNYLNTLNIKLKPK